jgi:hypothetical protein
MQGFFLRQQYLRHVVTKVWAENPAYYDLILKRAEGQICFLLHSDWTVSHVPTAACPLGTGTRFLGTKWPRRGADHLHLAPRLRMCGATPSRGLLSVKLGIL